MKKLSLLFVTLLTTLNLFGQNGKNETLTAPNSNSPYFLVDTSFIQGSVLEDTTTIYLHFANPTSTKITAFQVRFFYDTANFKAPQVKWGPVALSVTDKYGAYYSSSNWVNVSLVYTGNSSTFEWSDGAILKVIFPHKSGFDASAVDSLKVTPLSSNFSNIATSNTGVDMTLGVYSYNGEFLQPTLNFPFWVKTVLGAGTEGISVQYHQKKKTASTWNTGDVFRTDSTGLAMMEIPYDTSFYNVKFTVATDSLSDGSAISIVDAYRLTEVSVQTDTLSTYEYQEGDVNLDGNHSISDAFLVFNRLATSATTWNSLVSGQHNVKLFRKTEYDSIVNSSTFLTSKRGAYTIDKSINGLDSVVYYSYVLGDVTSTGYNTTSYLVAKIAPGNTGTTYVLDQQKILQHIDDSIQFVIPKLTISADNTADIPVTLVTHGNKVGAAQIGLEYDTNVFKFVSLDMGSTMSRWTSFLTNENGKVLWGGHESQMDPALVTQNTQVFTFKFQIKSTNWEETPIRVFSKAAGDENARDLNIIKTPTDATVIYRRKKDDLVTELVDGFRVYPNPVTEGYVLFDYYMETEHELSVGLINPMGQLVTFDKQQVYQGGEVVTGMLNMDNVANGNYILLLSTPTKTKYYRISKF